MGFLTFKTTIGLIVATLSTVVHAANLEQVAPFPKPESGFTRQVILLAPQTQEENFKVEILAGKTSMVDCNLRHFGGTLEEKSLQGWGYSFYRLEKVSGPVSTRKGCPGVESKQGLVPVVGDGFLLRYNSKLPIVLYVPEDVEVRYRIWSASSKVEKAIQE